MAKLPLLRFSASFTPLSKWSIMMIQLQGTALLGTVTTLTSLGFLMMGYDNGLYAGLSMPSVNSHVGKTRD